MNNSENWDDETQNDISDDEQRRLTELLQSAVADEPPTELTVAGILAAAKADAAKLGAATEVAPVIELGSRRRKWITGLVAAAAVVGLAVVTFPALQNASDTATAASMSEGELAAAAAATSPNGEQQLSADPAPRAASAAASTAPAAPAGAPEASDSRPSPESLSAGSAPPAPAASDVPATSVATSRAATSGGSERSESALTTGGAQSPPAQADQCTWPELPPAAVSAAAAALSDQTDSDASALTAPCLPNLVGGGVFPAADGGRGGVTIQVTRADPGDCAADTGCKVLSDMAFEQSGAGAARTVFVYANGLQAQLTISTTGDSLDADVDALAAAGAAVLETLR